MSKRQPDRVGTSHAQWAHVPSLLPFEFPSLRDLAFNGNIVAQIGIVLSEHPNGLTDFELHSLIHRFYHDKTAELPSLKTVRTWLVDLCESTCLRADSEAKYTSVSPTRPRVSAP